RAYEENTSGKDCPLSNKYPYAVRHDPFVYFEDVTDKKNISSAYCIEHVRPFEELAKDLTNNSVAPYNLITPNACNDMGPIGMIVLSPFAKSGYSNSVHYNHDNHGALLQSIEEIFGVMPYVGNTANQSDLKDLFQFSPDHRLPSKETVGVNPLCLAVEISLRRQLRAWARSYPGSRLVPWVFTHRLPISGKPYGGLKPAAR
ncbi:MAG: hypothetical protein WCA20_21010, partial [Candidatus Sulfotelmatobacter sp.]